MPSDENQSSASFKNDVVYPRVSIGLLHELGSKTKYRSWDKINELLKLGEDGHKAVRGQKPDRRNGYPRDFSKDTYLDALDEIAMGYAYALDPIKLTKQYLDSQGVRIREIDALFDEIALADLKQRDAKADEWWETVKDSLCFHFAYDNGEERTKPFAGDAQAARAQALGQGPCKTEARNSPPTLLRLVKSCLSDEKPNGLPWAAALQAMARSDSPLPAPPDKPIVFGRPLSDREFVEQLFPKEFEAFVDARFENATSFVDADMTRSTAFEAFEFFGRDQGLRFGAMAKRCSALMARADGPAFFERMAGLFEALERGSEHPRDVCAARTAFSRYACGSAARGLAFMLACALLGPENHRALAKVVGQPEASKR